MNSFLPIPSGANPPDLRLPSLPMAHPQFTAGAGYVLPGGLVADLYVAALNTRLLPIEDVFVTGHCARRIGRHPPANDGRFSCGQMVMRDCEMARMFTGHKVAAERQFDIWEAMQEGRSC